MKVNKNKHFGLSVLVILVVFFRSQVVADEPAVILDDIIAWPNLTVLPDGSFLLAGFDQSSHGQVEGDVSCWVSSDQGETWSWRGRLTEHEPQTVRMNHSVGLTEDGNLIGLVSGWTDVQQPGKIKRAVFRDKILRSWICQSKDGGKTWTVERDAFPTDPTGRELIPFGDIIAGEGGSLYAAMYSTSYWDRPGPWAAFFVFSADGGKSWQIRSRIANGINETALLSLGDGTWLAAARGTSTFLHRSRDHGETWDELGAVTGSRQIPAHLLRLKDGRIVLTYGDRNKEQYGVGAILSDDEGETWSEPRVLASMPDWDGGYPASVETADGRILTAYYGKKSDLKDYAVFRVFWEAEKNAGLQSTAK